MKEISIIIATYNAAPTIQRCLTSIVRQKTPTMEILLIDGGSDDDTMTIVRSFGDSIDYLISEKDEGIYDAWNKGLRKATGRWMMFLGADDYLLPDMLVKLTDYVQCQDLSTVDLITAYGILRDNHGKTIRQTGNPYDWNIFRRYMNICHGATLHNRQLFDEVGCFGMDYKICGDYELLLRKELKAVFFAHPVTCVQYGGMSCSYQAVKEAFQIRKQHHTISPIRNSIELLKGVLSVTVKKVLYK